MSLVLGVWSHTVNGDTHKSARDRESEGETASLAVQIGWEGETKKKKERKSKEIQCMI